MTPDKFFDYLEGKLPPAEKERFERALIADQELQRQLVTAREIHREMERSANAATARAGTRGRQVAAAFAVLVALNVAIGLFFIFRSNQPSPEVQKARQEALRYQLQSRLEKSAAAAFTPPAIGMERIPLSAPREKQEEVAKTIVEAAAAAGGSGTKGLPNENGFNVLVVIPAAAEAKFRAALAPLGVPSSSSQATPAPAANESLYLEIVVSSPR